jgi:hypothetical protein
MNYRTSLRVVSSAGRNQIQGRMCQRCNKVIGYGEPIVETDSGVCHSACEPVEYKEENGG